MCNKCNKKNNCGCEEIDSKCVIYRGVCLDTLDVCSGDNLENIIKIINDLITDVLFEQAKGITLSNIGDGVKVVANSNTLNGDYEIRSVKGGDESVDVYLDGDVIKVEINKEWLNENIPQDLVLNSIKNTILINGSDIDINPEMFISANEEELTITEESDGKIKFDVKVENLIKSVGEGTPIFTGLDMTDGKNKIRTLSFESDTLLIEGRANDEEGVVININTYPEDPNMKYFYVSSNYEGSIEDGSIGRPYKSLEGAVEAFIGDTNLYNRANPEFYNKGKIVLLSNIFVNVPLTLNGAVYDLGGNVLYYNGSSKMIDYEYLVDNSPKDTDGKLLNNVFMNVLNGTIDNRYNGNVAHIKHYHNGTIDSQNTVKVTLNNLRIIDNSHIGRESDFVKVTDFSGADVLVYSSNIYYSTLPLGEPLILIENVNFTNQGSVNIDNCTFSSGLRVPLECKNTTMNIYNSAIINSYSRFLVNGVNTDSSGYRFNAKIGLNMINNTNSYLALWNCSSELGASPVILGKRVIVCDKAFKLKTDSVNKGNLINDVQATMFISDFFLNSQVFNNLISFEGDVSFSTKDADFGTTYSLDNAVKRESGTNTLDISLDNGSIRDITNTSPAVIKASSAIVNGFEYTSNIGYADDTIAKANGLIVGNIYYNTTTGNLKRINS